jgi:hypothetical protein
MTLFKLKIYCLRVKDEVAKDGLNSTSRWWGRVLCVQELFAKDTFGK